MTHVTCRLTAENRDQLRNPTLGNRVWASFTFTLRRCPSYTVSDTAQGGEGGSGLRDCSGVAYSFRYSPADDIVRSA